MRLAPALTLALILSAAFAWAAAAVAPGRHPHHRTDPQTEAAARRARAQLLAAKARQQDDLAAQLQAETRAARDREQAAALSDAARDAATELRNTDQSAASTLARIDALEARRQALQVELARDSAALAPMVPLIERLSLYPSETLLATPASPADTLSGLMLLRGLGMQMEMRAEAIRTRQLELAQLTDQLQTRTQQLASLKLEQQARDQLVSARAVQAAATQRASADAADAAAREAAASAARAADLKDAVDRLQAAQQEAESRFQREAQAADAARKPALARAARRHAATVAADAGPGLLPNAAGGAPVAGPLVQAWGASTAAGPATGMTYAPPALATVISPCQGRIDFAGPFRSYGQMLILDCGHGYRFVIAGLARLDVVIGQNLTRGAPLGRMPDWNPGSAGRPSLYVQLRLGTEAIDPGVFLRSRS